MKLTKSLLLMMALCTAVIHGQEGGVTVAPGQEAAFASGLLEREGELRVEVQTLGNVLMRAPAVARRVFDSLREKGPAADLLHAELLYHVAVGWVPRRGEKAELMPTYEVCRRAAEFLDHPDPAVRMLADWAMDIRLSLECEGTFPRPWPDAEKHEWFAEWMALDGDRMLANDYMRRAFLENVHREPNRLVSLAADRVRRAEAAAARTSRLGGPALRPALERRLAAMKAELAKLRALVDRKPDMTAVRGQYLATRLAVREVVMSSPDINFDQLLFAVRNGNNANNITQGDLPQVFGAEGEIYIKSGLHPKDPVKPLLRGRLGQGHLRGLDLHWNADRILFSFQKQPGWEKVLAESEANYQKLLKGDVQTRPLNGWRGYNDNKGVWWCGRANLWEMVLASGELRQITDAQFNDDYEPAYLPGGDIVFVSDRSNYGSQCAGGPGQDKMITNLHRVRPDGSNLHAISNNKDFDRFPRVMDDGNVLFMHWEYQERHLYLPHALWRMYPDGTSLDTLYKQHIPHTPMSLRHARQIPGTSKLTAIACGHHVGAIGSVFIVDYGRGVNEGQGMRIVTPKVDKTEWNYGPWKTVQEGGVPDKGGYYHNPWPLSEKSLLASYSYNRDKHMARSYALYYLDVWGNKELIHRDNKYSTTYHYPLKKRPVPPVVTDRVDPKRKDAVVFTANVYEGVEGVKPGAIRYIRVSQHMPWPCVRDTETSPGIAFDDLHYNPSGPWTKVLGFNVWSPARSIGIVPVEKDGSALFKVPVRQPLYFQALDENFMEVRRMRSMVTLQPGETRGCLGCHETREAVPRNKGKGAALKRPPSTPVPPSWGAAIVPSFEEHIQPILDRNCVKCHGVDDPAGGIELSGRKIGGYFQSYRSMFGLKATDPTPGRKFHIDAWHRGNPQFTSENEKDYFKKYFTNKLPGQLVSISNYMGGVEVTKPYEFGSHKSKLITVLRNDPRHRKSVKMPEKDWIDLVTWIDLNAFYHSTYTYFTTKERVPVEWPNPWQRPPAGEWRLVDEGGKKKVILSADSDAADTAETEGKPLP
jgi:Hydrazine synthase alpha subunit middle domain